MSRDQGMTDWIEVIRSMVDAADDELPFLRDLPEEQKDAAIGFFAQLAYTIRPKPPKHRASVAGAMMRDVVYHGKTPSEAVARGQALSAGLSVEGTPPEPSPPE